MALILLDTERGTDGGVVMRGFYSQNERGSSLVGTVLAMLVMGYLGATMTQQNSSSAAVSTNEIQTSQALYLAQAGVETGLARLNNGQLADGVLNLGNGSVTISTDTVAGTMTATGVVGSARKVMTVHIDPSAVDDGTPGAGYRAAIGFARSCMRFDTSSAYLEGAQLKGVKLVKSCNAEAHMTELAIDWSFSDCAVEIDDGDTDDDGTGDAEEEDELCGNDKFQVCHNGNHPHTICISENGWENGHDGGQGAHSTDYLGACAGGDSDSDSTDDCTVDAGSLQMNRVYLDDLEGGQSGGDLLFSGTANHGEYVDAVRTFTENTDYNFGVTSSDESIVFISSMPSRVSFILKARFEDGSEIEAAVAVAYKPEAM